MQELFILTDYAGDFLVSISDLKRYTSMNVERIKELFVQEGFNVCISKYGELDLTQDFRDKYIIYQSSESKGIYYKHFIEDVICFLESKGAIVLPKSEYLRAHHNKVFMEMLRVGFSENCLQSPKSYIYGSSIEAANYNENFPVVIKKTCGAGSSGVYLAHNEQEYEKCIKIASNCKTKIDCILDIKDDEKKIANFIFGFLGLEHKFLTSQSICSPIVVQQFIEKLNGDYKVLVFGDKYYSLFRKNRDNDFRASGSGKFFCVNEEECAGLLDFAKKVTLEIDWPIIGMDIGFDGKAYHLFEFQMIHLGPYALQASKYWHEYKNGEWVRCNGTSVLEEEYCRSICAYIRKGK